MNEQEDFTNRPIERNTYPTEEIYRSLFDMYLDLRKIPPQVKTIEDPEIPGIFNFEVTRTISKKGFAVSLSGYVYKVKHIIDPNKLKYTKMEMVFTDNADENNTHLYRIIFDLTELDKLKFHSIGEDLKNGILENRRIGIPEIYIDKGDEEVDIRGYHRQTPEIQLLERILNPTIDPKVKLPKQEQIVLKMAIEKYRS